MKRVGSLSSAMIAVLFVLLVVSTASAQTDPSKVTLLNVKAGTATPSASSVTGSSLTSSTAQPVLSLEAEKKLKTLAGKRVLEEIVKRSDDYDGPEPRIASLQILDSDRVQVTVEYVSGWGEVPMPELTEQCLYVARDDQVAFLGHFSANTDIELTDKAVATNTMSKPKN